MPNQIEDPTLLLGAGRFIDDEFAVGQLHMVVLRSAVVLAAVSAALEARCEDPSQIAMWQRYFSRRNLPDGATGIEFRSGVRNPGL